MNRAREKKRLIFAKGVAAVEHYIGTAEYYICPLCMYGFPEAAIDAGQLTMEHVPPQKLGGRGLLLTCKECNNTSGYKLDAALYQREEQRLFAQTVLGHETEYKGRAKWIVDGETLNVEVYRDGKFLTIAGIPKENNPTVVKRMMEGHSGSGRLTSRVRYHRRRADVGDLRTAYLAAFALLGYRYAFHPVFNPIREQIAAPDSKVLDRWSVRLDTEVPVVRGILEAATPYRCLAVQLDRVAVLLPIPGRSDDLYEQLATATKGRVDLRGDHLGWPKTFELREDFCTTSRLPSLTFRVETDGFGAE
jgi:hypothetical protein